jgi:phosphohistidine phosphatase SixA
MCNLSRLPLSDDDRTVFVAAKSHANWIKQQVSTGLSDQDVRYVLISAATRARNELRQVIEVLKSNPPDVETAELYRWCTGTMKGIVQKVLGAHARQPGAIEQIIKEAKE